MGGKWNRKHQAHVFGDDPSSALEQVLLTGEITGPKDFGFFVTPPDLARRLVELAELTPTCTVLEPSAGHGALAEEAAKVVGRTRIQCVELLDSNVKVLTGLGFAVHQADFLGMSGFSMPFDCAIMNPPFSVQGDSQADVSHVVHAWGMVKPKGRLVAIMSAGVSFRDTKKSVAFRELVGQYGSIEVNPEGSFVASGTNVNSVMIVLNKP